MFIFMNIFANRLRTANRTVPPEACFATFRWEDCGGPPRQVLYYWKPGSRCEVGIWRGCLPNLNMFHDEYECVSTCIFSVRAQPPDYHAILEKEEIESQTEVLTEGNTTVSDSSNTADAVKTNATMKTPVNETVLETDNATDTTEGNAAATNSTTK
ncbi:jg7767 [Pararge aegeria aegeria]|uniref:Jg7767 protein n=1 Tax=Pararge aegeria aegeria TaxID=348720 RepID=A0A8S4QWD8_9NEOP|nr:jg7767 [Pararge aegeria aegeria]